MYDLIVVGGGPGGSAVASYIAKSGKKVLLIEKETFPRFRIGESLLPYSMEIFEDLGFDKVLAEGKYIRKEGAMFVDVAKDTSCYFDFDDGGKAKYPFCYEVDREIFDKDFLEHAQSLGVEVRQPEEYVDSEFFDDHVVVKTTEGKYQTKFVIDATGSKALIHRKFVDRVANPTYSNNFSVFTQFTGVDRSFLRNEGDICIGILKNNFWSWQIPFKGESTSIGIVANQAELAAADNLEEFFEKRLEENPWLRGTLKNATRTKDFKVVSNFSYTSDKFCGKRWASVGDAMSFLDPVFSSGVHLSLMSAKLISENILHSLENETIFLDDEANIKDYNAEIKKGVSRFNNLLQLFYRGDFVEKVKNIEKKKFMTSAMTCAVSGGMWEEDNYLYRMGVL
ncbi:hypothetical protein A9Q84_01265 [Halobacteriovorax marinus]|uniref:FAD-binding domain-containing protein n=1 Tax=Halobacteriovorax marinus TaxID=97084 RepID=A0A1Y5FBV7_9BACT|nr:hypothetical protein A9Q84_01265 [Halobacteriovorax marinus]